MSNYKDLKNWKLNAEENYINTPISVLKYITELEKHIGETEARHTAELNRQNSARFIVAFMGVLLGYALSI